MARPSRWCMRWGVSSWSVQKRSTKVVSQHAKLRKTAMFDILQYTFIQNALLAGSCVAVVAAVAGYFMIVRGLTFAGHALPNIGFAGAAVGGLRAVVYSTGVFVFFFFFPVRF